MPHKRCSLADNWHNKDELELELIRFYGKYIAASWFPSWSKYSFVDFVFKNSGDIPDTSNYCPIRLWLILPRGKALFHKSNMVSIFLHHIPMCQWLLVMVITNGNYEESRDMALDISKAYERVWKAGICHKLKVYGVYRRIFYMIQSPLKDRIRRVVLNAFSTRYFHVNVGNPAEIYPWTYVFS